MDFVSGELVASLTKCGAIPDPAGLVSWERQRGVYLVKTGFKPEGDHRPFILKPLKLGTVQAFLSGALLDAAELFFKEAKTGRDYAGPAAPANILPPLVKPSGGGNYLWFRGGRFLLTGWLKGREADYYRTPDLQAAIRTMKIFHRFTQDLIAGNPARWSFLKFDLRREWRKRLREMAGCREMALGLNNDWCRQYLHYWPEFNEQAEAAVRAAERRPDYLQASAANEREVICYHDWAYHNVIIADGKAFLIDFDALLMDRPVHDRANLIGRYLRLNNWRTGALDKIMAAFDRYYAWRAGELHWLWIYLTFPYDYWMLGRQYFIERQPWSMRYYRDQWERKIAGRLQRRRILDLIQAL